MRTEEYLRGWYAGVKYAARQIKEGKLTPEEIERLHPEYYEEIEDWKTEEEWKKRNYWGDVI